MLDLEFAFFNLIDTEKRGLIYQKIFLDRLAPILFSPRVKTLIDLPQIDFSGCNISLPLGQGNWTMLEQLKQKNIFNKSINILNNYSIKTMAVDRKLKVNFLELSSGFPMLFGDNFIKALAAVLLRDMLSQKDIKKLVIVGDTENFADFIEEITAYGLPVSLQNYYPGRYESFAYHCLYEKGFAVSTSYISPENWEKGDLVLILDTAMQQLAVASPKAFCIKLSNNTYDLAPELENSLSRCGVDPALHNLAPILETYLFTKAGFSYTYKEQDKTEGEGVGKRFRALQEIGDRLDLWQLFLDKGM